MRSRAFGGTVQAISTNACPSVFFKALNFDIPTAASSSTATDSGVSESASVARDKANNLHATLSHSGLSNLQFCVHEHGVQFPNIAMVDSTGFHFEIFPTSVGPIEFEGGIIKSREVFWGLNAANGLVIPDTLGAALDDAPVTHTERRQVWELPVLRCRVTEQREEHQRCPQCRVSTPPPFPAQVTKVVQYGPRAQAVGVYWRTYQLLPQARASELCEDLFGRVIQFSEE